MARAQRGSNRRSRLKVAIGRLRARVVDRREDWVEQTSTGVGVRAKAGLKRSIHAAGWGRLVERLELNAAKNIAAGRAVTCLPRPTYPDRPPVREALQPLGGAVNREPQPVPPSG